LTSVQRSLAKWPEARRYGVNLFVQTPKKDLFVGDFASLLTASFQNPNTPAEEAVKAASEAFKGAIDEACSPVVGTTDPKNKYLRATGIAVYAPASSPASTYLSAKAPWADRAWTRLIQGKSA
jgi:hypothetical protein